MNEEKKIQFAFGIEQDGHCEGGKFNSIEELLDYARSSLDEMDGDPNRNIFVILRQQHEPQQ